MGALGLGCPMGTQLGWGCRGLVGAFGQRWLIVLSLTFFSMSWTMVSGSFPQLPCWRREQVSVSRAEQDRSGGRGIGGGVGAGG